MIEIKNGVMLNAYPDSIGKDLSDLVSMLQMPAFDKAFSLFYVLPTFFNSDLDRGFSIIDYNINEELVSEEDITALKSLGIMLKFDIVLNHLSVASPQFEDLIEKGNDSKFKDFFIDWNEFWEGHGTLNQEGIIIPEKEYLDKLFMRKSGLPILNIPFPNGEKRPYWNTFYQKIIYQKINPEDLTPLDNLSEEKKKFICQEVNPIIEENNDWTNLDLEISDDDKIALERIINSKRSYLGQMDVNAKSPLVWEFYEEVLSKVSSYGCQILRLDAFAQGHGSTSDE